MLFSSITFLYYFIPCVVLIYFLVPKRLKNGVLLLSSLFFYAWGEPKYLLLMLISIFQGYLFGRLIEKKRHTPWAKIFVLMSIFFSLGTLAYYKYVDFFITNFNHVFGLSIPLLRITLPIGISFYTFQMLSYIIDVYKEDVQAQKSLLNLATYITMFPQLIAGPIVRYSDIEKQLNNRHHSIEDIALGLRLFLVGLSKKILLANVLGELVVIFKSTQQTTVLFYWLYAIAFTLQIYFDFSGYSDMAIGLGHIFGFHFPKNFDYPYISKSITEFWRRWHISLGSWFRDYLYIPLGGNRVSKGRWLFNILIVWMATGFWHGANWNFILWGLFFAILLMIEKLWLLPYLKKYSVISHIYVLLLITVSFMIFDATSLSEIVSALQSMFHLSSIPLFNDASIYYLKSYFLIFMIAIIASTPIPKKIALYIEEKHPTWTCILEPLFFLGLLVICTAYLVDGSFNPFLYFRF